MAKEPDQSNALHNKYKVSFNTATSYLLPISGKNLQKVQHHQPFSQRVLLVNIIVAGWKIYLTMLKVDQSTEYL